MLSEEQADLVHQVGDVATLTRQLKAIAEGPDTYRRMRDAGLAHRDNLGWHRAGPELYGIYDKGRAAMSSGPGRRTGLAPDGSSSASPGR